MFGPWTYLGPAVLNDARRKAIAKLPAHAKSEHAGGWIVQAVPDLYAKPSKEFLAGLEALPNPKPVVYKQSKLPK
jgi:hypothetical protein